jgi:hypothetical protein
VGTECDVNCGARGCETSGRVAQDVTRQTETIDRWPVGQPSRLRSGSARATTRDRRAAGEVCSKQSYEEGPADFHYVNLTGHRQQTAEVMENRCVETRTPDTWY